MRSERFVHANIFIARYIHFQMQRAYHSGKLRPADKIIIDTLTWNDARF